MADPKLIIETSLNTLRRDPRDKDAWAQFYQYFRAQVAGMLVLLGVRNKEDVADLCQEVFYRFLRYSPWKDNWATLPDRLTIMAYLRTSTRNLLATYVGKKMRGREVSLDELGSELVKNPAFWVTGERTDFPELLGGAIDNLSPEDRKLLGLLITGSSLSEIAQRYGISYSAAGVRVHRLKDRIRGAKGK